MEPGLSSDSLKILPKQLEAFCFNILQKLQVREEVARSVAFGLVETSARGVDSHGIALFPHYIRALQGGRINPNPDYRFEKTGAATARLDADHTFGHAAGYEAMRRALLLAKEAGTGTVAVRNSSHFGAAGCFALFAARENKIGLSFTHADALMLSSGGERPFFGTNPIAFAAPCEGEEPFCLDMATTVTNWNKLKQKRAAKERIPLTWGADDQGNPNADPEQVVCLLPIGDYKGFGLAFMIDILCGLLTGMPMGREISSMYKAPIEQKRLLGHFFMAIDIERFLPLDLFKKRLQQMISAVREEPAKFPNQPVLVPGDPEKRAYALRSREGIPLSPELLSDLQTMAKSLEIQFP